MNDYDLQTLWESSMNCKHGKTIDGEDIVVQTDDGFVATRESIQRNQRYSFWWGVAFGFFAGVFGIIMYAL